MAIKEYVFTRTPEGDPYCKDERYAPREILKQISDSVRTSEDGSYLLDFSCEKFISLLPSAILIKELSTGRILNFHDSHEIIRSSLLECISDQPRAPLTFHRLKSNLNKKAKEYFSKTKLPFCVVTSIAIKELRKSRIRIDDHIISFNMPYKVKTMLAASKTDNFQLDENIEIYNACKFIPIIIECQARTPSEAFHLGMKSADTLRALWTTFSTRGSWKYSFGTTTIEPITVMPYGPTFFIYDKTGHRMCDIFWRNQSYPINPGFNLFGSMNKWRQIETIRLKAMKSIKKLPYKDQLIEILIRYINALDSLDHTTSFLHLWSVLETITIPKAMQYDKLIDRATRPFNITSRPIVKEILKLIRTERNNLTHNAKLNADATQLAYHLKLIVDFHIQSLIFNEFKIDSISEYSEILDLSTNACTLQKKRRMIQTIMKREVSE